MAGRFLVQGYDGPVYQTGPAAYSQAVWTVVLRVRGSLLYTGTKFELSATGVTGNKIRRVIHRIRQIIDADNLRGFLHLYRRRVKILHVGVFTAIGIQLSTTV